MACGSNTHTRPACSRAAVVVVHTSGLLEVASTAPGASSIAGVVSAVVLPARGAITAMSTSSIDAYSTAPLRRPKPNTPRVWWRPNATPAAPGGISEVGVAASDGRSRRAFAATCGRVRAATARVSARDGSGSSPSGRWICHHDHTPQMPPNVAAISTAYTAPTTGGGRPGHSMAQSPRSIPSRNGASKSGPAGVPATAATIRPAAQASHSAAITDQIRPMTSHAVSGPPATPRGCTGRANMTTSPKFHNG